MEQRERHVEQRERAKEIDQHQQQNKASRISSVKEFVNRLEEEKERNIGIRRPSCWNSKTNNQQQQPHSHSQTKITQKILNQSGSSRA